MGVTTVIIKSDGKEIDPHFALLSVDVTKEFNKIPVAELQYIDGDAAKQEFKILDGDVFEPGKKIEITLHEGDPKDGETVFTGIVVDQRTTGSTLTIELSDEAIKMTAVRKSAVHANKKDSDIVKELIKQNKLKAGTLENTKVTHAHMVQYYASDWDFMLSRAEVNGLLVAANDGEVSVIRPEVKKPSIELTQVPQFFEAIPRPD